MAQWVKALVTKPEDLSSVPRSVYRGGRRESTPKLCPLTSTVCVAYTHTCVGITQIHTIRIDR